MPTDSSPKRGGNLLLYVTLCSVIGGVLIGAGLRTINPTENTIRLVGFPGEVFLNTLKSMVLPLIAASLTSGLAALDQKTSGKLGTRAFAYYTLTTVLAVVLGVLIATLFHPGDPSIKARAESTPFNETVAVVGPSEKFLDLIRNMFSENIARSMFQQQETVYRNVHGEEKLKVVWTDGMNVLGIIMFSILMGVAISSVGEIGKPLADFFSSLDAVVTRMMRMIMWLGPIGIPSMIAQKMLEVTDIFVTAKTLAFLILTVLTGLATLAFLVLPLIYFSFTKKNPFKFMVGLRNSYLNGFATASSASILPITFQCLFDLGLDQRVVKFALPVGTMLSTMGTALYEAIAPIFIAQMNGIELEYGQLFTLIITATLASLGASAIPSAGLVTMLLVLSAIGLPVSDLSLIFTIDWFLDRLRTCTNITGVTIGCAVVNELSKTDLEEMEMEEKEESKC